MTVNHAIRVVTLVTGERVLCIFGDLRDEENKVVGYKLFEPFTLKVGDPQEDGSMPIKYNRWCMFSPEREYLISGTHIIAASVPDQNILDTYVSELEEKVGITRDQIFVEENTDGDNSEPTEAGE
ncbi:hypothetical protein PQC11_gp134 [Synechococcus phage S-H9-1]|uniref:Uncharacterized protein n=1 Tax=Synechococcus phage S-H9-1 TaxID=2783674 RepID=A0A873WSY3_9CAUD|nr:hypothetical protein PQC11_gp134 [Synechococcus phage S-H9-1]QPB08194.1 hypothetical protein [Synechococcus phage S-H9-1]